MRSKLYRLTVQVIHCFDGPTLTYIHETAAPSSEDARYNIAERLRRDYWHNITKVEETHAL